MGVVFDPEDDLDDAYTTPMTDVEREKVSELQELRSHPRPTRAQAMAAVEELYAAAFEIGRLDNTIQLARNRDVTEKLSGRIHQLRYEIKQAKETIIHALTEGDES